MIEFSDFSFQYKSQKEPTIHDVNLTIRNGEKILIAGASGSGKSTIGNCINGLIPHALGGIVKGSLRIDGKETSESDIYEISKVVGTVLQDTDAQFVGLTVGEDIAFSLENQCVPTAQMHESVRDVASMVSMQDFLDSKPDQVSGGQKQRVALSGVLVDDVSVLLFDEPLAALDPATGELAIELIDELHEKTGKTVVIIEHRVEDVLHRPVDRIVLVDEGRIVMDDTPAHVLQSGILIEKGTREPLYVSALRNAGCDISHDENIATFDSLDIAPYRDDLMRWFSSRRRNLLQSENDVALSFMDVTYSYDGRRNALDSISFDIRKGEMVSILGKNGAGKSTLAGLLTGILTPDSGSIFIDGRDAGGDSIAERSRKIGYVMQNPNHMISHAMIYDEVAFGLRQRGLAEDEIRERVMKVLRLCSLAPYHKWPVSALSYGQKKRVTIASILVMEPEILILDEPTAGQDFRRYTMMMGFLEEINRKTGVTILFVTHDLHLALEYTPRSIVLADGHLLADAPISQVFADEDLLSRANLKTTSLYLLSKKLGLSHGESIAFIETFIVEERHRRGLEESTSELVEECLLTFDVRILAITLAAGLLTLSTSRVPVRVYRPILILVLLSVFLNAFFIYLFSPLQGPDLIGTRTILFGLPDVRYAITLETLWYLLIVVLKYFSISPIAISFIYCTQPSEFASSLNRLHISYKISYAISLAFRYIPVIMSDYKNIRDGQECRGVEMSDKAKLKDRINAVTRTLSPLVLSSLDKIDIITNAMVLRGFGRMKKRTWFRSRPLKAVDWILILFMLAILALAMVLRFAFGVKYWYPF